MYKILACSRLDSFPIFFSSSFLSFNRPLQLQKHTKEALENSPYLERENRDKKW